MMSQIYRYLFQQVSIALVSITLILTTAIWLAYSLRFIDYIINRGLPLATFLYLIVLMLPRFLGIALPIALFCAVLFVYYRLVTDSELVVLRATGLSDIRLARPPLMLAGVVMLIVAVLNIHYAPAAERAFKDLQFAIRNNFASLLIQPGVFKSIGNGMTLYVEEDLGAGQFRGILIHDNKDGNKRVTVMAEQGAIVASATGPRVVLINGNRQEFDRQTGKLSLLYFEKYTVDLGLLGDSGEDRWRDTRERSIGELLSVTAEDVGEKNVGKFRAEGHERIISIFYAPALTTIALVVMLFGNVGRRGYGRRILLAATMALAVEAGALWLKGMIAKFPAMTPALYAIALMPILVGGLFLVRPWRYRRRELFTGAVAVGGAAGR